jgi:D-serine deaminase-like pyridoxal phosphate-dependent protein
MAAEHSTSPPVASAFVRTSELQTPALVVSRDAFRHNLATMSAALPGARLRPHVKAHKCTSIARAQSEAGHNGFTCATIREVEGMAKAGLGADLLLANEVVDARRLGDVAASGARVTVAVDSDATVDAAAAGGVREVLVDVDVGMPRCGCAPDDAGRLADYARSKGLEVRGVMGYEGHLQALAETDEKRASVEQSMQLLLRAHEAVGGDLISAGGTGTYALNTWANEIQAGSYALMDTAYGEIGLPFRQALFVEATVISVSPKGWAVADCGLKALGMDHGNPAIEGANVWFCSDEHVTFSSDPMPSVGDRIRVVPAHVDPTVAYHEALHVIDGDDVVEVWPVDLRGW